MKLSRSMILGATVVAAMAASAPSTRADVFDGATVGYQYRFPNQGDVYFDPGPIAVGAGVEIPQVFGGGSGDVASLDISGDNLFIDFYGASSWTSSGFNGFRLFDINNSLDAFTGVNVNGATNLGGFGAGNITFDADNIWVNWQGLSFDQNTVVSLDVEAVPEPGTILLVGSGLVGLAVRRRRARS